MAALQPSLQDRRPPPDLSLNLSSNNPFRNRAVSPNSLQSEPSPRTPPVLNNRPVSRNPFLDHLDSNVAPASAPLKSPQDNIKSPQTAMASQQALPITAAADQLNNLSIHSRPGHGAPPVTGTGTTTANGIANGDRGPRVENVHPQHSSRMKGANGAPAHRSTRSQEEEARQRNGAGFVPHRPHRQKTELDIFADPVDSSKTREKPRLRRNSDSSVMSARNGKLLDPNDDRRRRDRERRHRDGRHRDPRGQAKEARSSPKSKKPNQRLDIIDKLDVTSIYGTGLFHHDGPFDACNPHRNRKNSTRAPMQAFPKDSANNAIGGSGPLHKDIDHNLFHGNRGAEAFSDFSRSGTEPSGADTYARPVRPLPDRSQSFNPTARVDPVHGDESLGLGTSTFLEGAPASKTAMQRRESETEAMMTQGAGLARKKSLAQKIRGINQGRPFPRAGGRILSPEPKYENGSAVMTSPDEPTRPFSSSGVPRPIKERDSFFNEYNHAYEKKGESIRVAERETPGRERAPSSPRRGLERRITHDATGTGVGSEKPSGFLSRVKSLRGGKRQRPGERLN
ncbi:MAG: hypothetical protein M1817_004854 [Caeruleum heppii]|nr:MAG: hypothetical protein M1817_004854 [Caeruleum heppii]